MEYKLNDEYKNIRILIVEDDIQTLEKLHNILKKVYAEIVTAENGSEALIKFKEYYSDEKYFDLIISDLNMPKINGLELLELIRTIDEFVPFIFLTAHLEVNTLLKVVKLDIHDYLKKPINIDELITSINKTTKKKLKDVSNKEVNIFLSNNFYWNTKNRSLHINDSLIKLTRKELELLDILFKNINISVSTELIIYKLWEECVDFDIAVINLKNLLSRLRKKVPQLDIKNTYGLGYQIRSKDERI
jgi:two-component system, OmpR family, response regulator VanR